MDPRRWQALALVCVAFFMTVLDVSIVNVALPSIKTSFNVSDQSLQWVLIAYTITFGGFLLLGGRAADLLGRRRVFMAGVALFSVASLACGLSGSIGVLIAARAVQGLGAAIISPATLAIITTTFDEGAERNKALGIWGAMGGSGAAAGVLFGGIIVNYLGWEWIFFVNVPVGVAVLALTRPLVRESRITGLKGFDVGGAVTITSSLALLVYAVSKAPDAGWSSARTIGLLIASGVLLLAFIAIERRHPAPLVPVPDLPREDGHGRERVRRAARRGRVRELLPADAVRAAGARLLGAEDGAHVPLHRRNGDPRRRRIAGADDEVRAATGAGGRDGADHGRDALVHADLALRRLRREPARRLSAHGRRHGVRLHPDVDRRARRRGAARGRARLGADQHVAADRRRARRRGRRDDRVHTRDEPAEDGRSRRRAPYTSGFALAFWVLAGVSAAAVVTTLLLVRPVPEAAVEAEAAEAAI